MPMLLTEIAAVKNGIARSGRAAGARRGDWFLRLVESSDIPDDGWLATANLREEGFVRSIRTERHLLRPLDLLLTSRGGALRVALVPTDISRAVAGITLLVVRPHHPDTGISYWLWYYLTSAQGKAQLARHRTRGTTLSLLYRRNLLEIDVPVPAPSVILSIAGVVEAAEAAYRSSIEAARLRREVLRDALVGDIIRRATATT